MKIRDACTGDIICWSNMRAALWPGVEDNHISEIKDYFNGQSSDIIKALMIEVQGEIVGFMELNIRTYAEGSSHPRVPYVEAWFVKPAYQGKGYGRRLLECAERWAVSEGYEELASDADLENEKSIAIHGHMGFIETERIVCFLKKIKTCNEGK